MRKTKEIEEMLRQLSEAEEMAYYYDGQVEKISDELIEMGVPKSWVEGFESEWKWPDKKGPIADF